MSFSVALFTVAVALLLVLDQTEAVTFVEHSNTMLKNDRVTHTSVHVRPCQCRAECYNDENCGAYSIRTIKERAYLCSFVAGNITRDNLTEVAEDQGVATHLKGPPCPAPYVEVPRAGCFLISTNPAVRDVAMTSCLTGSQLYTPDERIPAAFWNLVGYLSYTHPSTDLFWTSLSRNGNSFSSPSGTSISTVMGEGFWARGEPNNWNNEEDGAAIKNIANGLNDLANFKKGRYICQKF